ncbi:NYN domain-containing protein [Spiroplasma floricola]|uniref:NYN domain-containing protein n=1 Tax=Spiroplasma floricola 23-6 TaxID=1336749 RepID=A0A2K8SEC6_9MOLU|nr:NYN domain-containing protein [Spiroplasma floricola]AUB31763.1 hypothetical protein SFLOR_v1c07150 [Spiroplasma floricola 23-6]
MEIKNKNIALFIDFDNFNNEQHFKILIEELEQMGNILYKGAFYSDTKDKEVKEKATNYGITDFIVEPSYSKGKNTVDIRMALDVQDMLFYKEYIDCFCLATNDLDFAPILKRLKLKNKTVIGAGLSGTNQLYKKICDRFISVDTIEQAIGNENNKKSQTVKNKSNSINLNDKKVKELIELVNNIMDNNDKDDQGYIQFSVVIENLYKKLPDFNPKNYGASNNKTSIFFKDILKEVYSMKIESKTYFIKLK